jgi:hypothetical protein
MNKKEQESRLDDSKLTDTRWPLWLTKYQVAARLRKSVSVIKKLQARGYLHPVLKNGISLFALTEVEALARPGRRPSPWLTSAPKSRGGRAKGTSTHRTEGQEAAHVFRMLKRGMSLRDIVMRAHVPPHRVRLLYREWKRSLDEGPPALANAVGDSPELDALAAAAEDLFTHER